jgi:prophage tail gpP-like protein
MTVTLKVNGQLFTNWSRVKITRGLKQGASSFEFETPGELVPAIVPFQSCTIMDGSDLLLTGYVWPVSIDVEPRSSSSVIAGKSKTGDLVDCHLLGVLASNQLTGNKLDAIARLVCAPFGITVSIAAGLSLGDAFPDATLGAETAWQYLERLARQRAVLLTDNAAGNLVLTRAGTARAPANLTMGPGGNVHKAKGELTAEGRFSVYRILSQAGIGATVSEVVTNVEGQAQDGAVPRNRPWCAIAESSLLPGDAQLRAQWEASHRAGEAVKATLTVPDWRAGGVLWKPNQIATCNVPRLELDDDFLIAKVTYLLDAQGKRVELEVSPPSAFSPEPGLENQGGNAAWNGVINVTGQNATQPL